MQIKEIQRVSYQDDDFFEDLYGKKTYKITEVVKAPDNSFFKSLKSFGNKHPTSIIVTLVQFYLLVIMMLLHTNVDLIVYTLIMMTGYIMGSVAAIMDNDTIKLLDK
jgi:hypothetical protein